MKFLESRHEIKYFGIRRVSTGMIILGCFYYQVHNAGEAAAAAAPLRHGMVDLGWHDKLPAVFVEELGNDLPDFTIGDVVATADQHALFSPSNMTLAILFI
jgi:hypothetical protein